MNDYEKRNVICIVQCVAFFILSFILLFSVNIGQGTDRMFSKLFGINFSYIKNLIINIDENNSIRIFANVLLCINKTVVCLIFYLVSFYTAKIFSGNKALKSCSAIKYLWLVIKNTFMSIIKKDRKSTNNLMSIIGVDYIEKTLDVSSCAVVFMTNPLLTSLPYSLLNLFNYIF